jgi:hypothetical protein
MSIKVRAPILKKTTKFTASIDSWNFTVGKTESNKYSPSSQAQSDEPSSRIKLRDYLFLAQKSSNKSAKQKRTMENRIEKKESKETACSPGECSENSKESR